MTGTPSRDRPAGVVLDVGNVLIDWVPLQAVAAGLGEVEARGFLGTDEIDLHASTTGRTPVATGTTR